MRGSKRAGTKTKGGGLEGKERNTEMENTNSREKNIKN